MRHRLTGRRCRMCSSSPLPIRRRCREHHGARTGLKGSFPLGQFSDEVKEISLGGTDIIAGVERRRRPRTSHVFPLLEGHLVFTNSKARWDRYSMNGAFVLIALRLAIRTAHHEFSRWDHDYLRAFRAVLEDRTRL